MFKKFIDKAGLLRPSLICDSFLLTHYSLNIFRRVFLLN